MSQAVIIDAARTPIGRASADKGYYRDVRADDLSAHVIQALVQRTGIDPASIEDVPLGLRPAAGRAGLRRRADRRAGRRPAQGDGGRDDQPQLRLEPPGDQRRRHEHRRRLRGRADRRRRRAHGPRADVEGLQPQPAAVPPAQRGGHEHGADRRVPGDEVPNPSRQAGRVRPPQPPARRRGDRQGRVPATRSSRPGATTSRATRTC